MTPWDSRLTQPKIVIADKVEREPENIEEVCKASVDRIWIPVTYDLISMKAVNSLRKDGPLF